MSADKENDHASADAHGGHDDHAPATDVIPESSPQDLVLKIVTILAAGLIYVQFGWWMTLDLSHVEGGQGGAETTEH